MTRPGTAKWQSLGYRSRAEWLIAGGDDASPCPPGVEYYLDADGHRAMRMRRKPGRPPRIRTPEELHVEGRKLVRFDPASKATRYVTKYTTDRTYWITRDKRFALRCIPRERNVYGGRWQVSEIEWIEGPVNMVPGVRAFSIHHEISYTNALWFIRYLPPLQPREILPDDQRRSWPVDNETRERDHFSERPPFEVWTLECEPVPYHDLDPATYQSPLMKRLDLSPAEYPIPAYVEDEHDDA